VKTREERIAWYRERAADCRELAKTSPDERSRAMLEDMATKWERLASLTESGEVALRPLPSGIADRAGCGRGYVSRAFR
jgi:hypothetical protein